MKGGRASLLVHRGEISILALGVALWIVLASVVTWRLADLNREFPGCLSLVVVGADCTGYVSAGSAWDKMAGLVQWMGLGMVVVAGVSLGAPIVAREVESGAAQMSWAIARSRARWLWTWTVPPLAVCTALVVMVALGAEFLARARVGFEDPGFFEIGLRGIVLIARGVLALAIGSFVGASLGRLLPAVLAGLLLTGIANVAGALAIDQMQTGAATLVRVQDVAMEPSLMNGRSLGQIAVLPDGTVTRERDLDKLPAGTDFDWVLIVPATQVPAWTIVEFGLLAGTATIVFGATIVATQRRKPY